MKFVEKVRRMRDEKGRAELQLVEDTGLPHSTLKNYLRGTRTPSFAAVMALARAFEVPLDAFAECSDLRPPRNAMKPSPVQSRSRPRQGSA
jgi:transcriptional regulator with XRE-family HTH domain